MNVLDPTDPSSWPARTQAAMNAEKYNTVGGNKFVAAYEHADKPDLWRYDPLTDSVQQVRYGSLVKGSPPKMTPDDAMGWFSDNTRFRSKIAGEGLETYQRAFKQAKYDVRNIGAYRWLAASWTTRSGSCCAPPAI